MVRTIRSSAPMRMNAFGVKVVSAPLAADSRKPSTKAPPAAVARNLRREISVMIMTASSNLRGLLDGLANAHIGPAATDISGHRIVDVGIGRTRVAREQRRRGHDLA